MANRMNLTRLPQKDSPDYFRLLIRNCIETYKELPNDAMCLDYNKVSGKLRAMVLDDEEYRQETRNIRAQQCLEELREIGEITRLTSDDLADEDGDALTPRGGKKKINGVDKDALTLRLKSLSMRRERIADLNAENGASERDAITLMFVGMTREEVEESARNELYGGDADDALEALASPKEEAPEGTAGKLRTAGQTRPLDAEEFFETLPDGEVVEK